MSGGGGDRRAAGGDPSHGGGERRTGAGDRARAGQDPRPGGGAPVGGRRAVALGGGHGLSRSLKALAGVADEVTAVVTTADDGGSSGRLRRDLGVVPPGDLRMAVAALGDGDLVRLLQYRFDRGELAGHSLGNLVLVALAELSGGDLVAALDRVAALVGVRGRVLPCTTVPVDLAATTTAGEVSGQVRVAQTARVTRVRIEPPDPPVTPGVAEAIEGADLVVLGPGSLFTSIIPNLLVPGVAGALSRSGTPVVLVANLREQISETEGMSLAEHLEALADHAPDVEVDAVVAHDGPAPSGAGRPLSPDVAGLGSRGVRVVAADLLDGRDGHDPGKLAAVLGGLLEERPIRDRHPAG